MGWGKVVGVFLVDSTVATAAEAQLGRQGISQALALLLGEQAQIKRLFMGYGLID